jgi:hypothetical protein
MVSVSIEAATSTNELIVVSGKLSRLKVSCVAVPELKMGGVSQFPESDHLVVSPSLVQFAVVCPNAPPHINTEVTAQKALILGRTTRRS